MNKELKPCPFCGGKAYFEQVGTHRRSTIVACDSCGCHHESGYAHDQSANGWNTREPNIEADRQAKVEPVFWYKPRVDGGYEGPVHNDSVGGKMLRDEKPGEWKPLYTVPQPQQQAMRQAIEMIETALHEAYGNAYPECCGNGSHAGCCGNAVQSWDEADQRIMDVLSPIRQKLCTAMLETTSGVKP